MTGYDRPGRLPVESHLSRFRPNRWARSLRLEPSLATNRMTGEIEHERLEGVRHYGTPRRYRDEEDLREGLQLLTGLYSGIPIADDEGRVIGVVTESF